MIVINAPGDGEWIMAQNEASFRAGPDNSIANHGPDGILGGFVVSNYLGASVFIHMAGRSPGWCTRQLLGTVFHYVFSVLRCHKAFAPIASDNYVSLKMCLRAGWNREVTVYDAFAPGRHLVLLGMEAGNCRWLRITLR